MSRWRPIPGLETYLISDLGEVKDAETLETLPNRAHPQGYRQITLGGRGYLVHRLVLLAFTGPPPSPHHEAAHGNGRRRDNRHANLSWQTPRGNAADKKIHGTACAGEKHPAAKLTKEQVAEIRARLKRGETGRALAKAFNVSAVTVSYIRRGRRWKGV